MLRRALLLAFIAAPASAQGVAPSKIAPAAIEQLARDGMQAEVLETGDGRLALDMTVTLARFVAAIRPPVRPGSLAAAATLTSAIDLLPAIFDANPQAQAVAVRCQMIVLPSEGPQPIAYFTVPRDRLASLQADPGRLPVLADGWRTTPFYDRLRASERGRS